MFRTAKQLKACSLLATDGEIGRVKDLWFDTLLWNLRYFVVDPGKWTKHRQVLISPESTLAPDWHQEVLRVDLTREQIRTSPGLETDQPVSRQYEAAIRKHYGWPVYWGVAYSSGPGIPPIDPVLATPPPIPHRVDKTELEGDPHLFSANAVAGHHVMAADGEIGHVEDFLFDEHVWAVRYLVVSTRNWWPGKKVILSPWWTSDINWPERRIHMNLTRDAIKASPPYDPEKTLTMEDALHLHDYYGRPRWADTEALVDAVVRSDHSHVP
ncbi:MAG TPA: PRC-barrel domain-containing protein [Lacunisphaera sp.]